MEKKIDFLGVVDLVNMNARVYYDDLGEKYEITEIPSDMLDLAKEYREKLLENIAEHDERVNDEVFRR